MKNNYKSSRLVLLVFVCLMVFLTGCGGRVIVDDTTKETGLQSSIVIDDDGIPLIVYFDKTERRLKLAVCADAKCSDYALHVVDDEGATGQYPSIQLNAQGNPVISYYAMSKKALKVAVCDDRTCSSSQRMLLEDETSDKSGEFTSLKLNSQGFPVISHYDSKNRHLKVAICKDALCANYEIVLVDDGEKVGKSTSLALTDNDFPVISYFDEENGYLKVAICQDAMCTDSVLRTFVSGEAEAGEYNSLALNNQGFPVISYQLHDSNADPTVGALKVMLCQDALCQNAATATIAERNAARIGAFNAMALNSKGNPVIAYWDAEPRAVKIATCRDPICSSVGTRDAKFDWGLQFISLAINADDKAYVSCLEVRPNKSRLVLLKP